MEMAVNRNDVTGRTVTWELFPFPPPHLLTILIVHLANCSGVLHTGQCCDLRWSFILPVFIITLLFVVLAFPNYYRPPLAVIYPPPPPDHLANGCSLFWPDCYPFFPHPAPPPFTFFPYLHLKLLSGTVSRIVFFTMVVRESRLFFFFPLRRLVISPARKRWATG